MMYSHIVAGSKGLKSFFGEKGFFGCGSLLKMTIEKFAVVVKPEGAVCVLALRCVAHLKWDMTSDARDHLFNGDKVTGVLNRYSEGSS